MPQLPRIIHIDKEGKETITCQCQSMQFSISVEKGEGNDIPEIIITCPKCHEEIRILISSNLNIRSIETKKTLIRKLQYFNTGV